MIRGKKVNTNDLITELAKPAYDAKTVAEKVAMLKDKTIAPVDGTNVSVTREQIRAVFDPVEFIALTPQKQNAVLAVLQSDAIFVEGADATLLATAFGGTTNTLPALATLRTSAIDNAKESIADQIGFGAVSDEELADWIMKVGM